MKTYDLCIIDNEGNTILDKPVSADEVIQFLLASRYEREDIVTSVAENEIVVPTENELEDEQFNAPQGKQDLPASIKVSDHQDTPPPPKSTSGRRVLDKMGILKAIKRDEDWGDIAETFGTTRQVIINIKNKNKKLLETMELEPVSESETKLNSRGLPSRETVQEQEESVFTEEIREQIKDLREQDMTTSEIAKELNLPPDDVAKVMSRASSAGYTKKGSPINSLEDMETVPKRVRLGRSADTRSVSEKIQDAFNKGFSVDEVKVSMPHVSETLIEKEYSYFQKAL